LLGFICSSNNAWISLLQNYLVGIACSIIVVIITTLLQFNYEQKKAKNKIVSEIRELFFQYYLSVLSSDPNETIPKQTWDYFFEKIEKNIDNIVSQIFDLEWFGKKHQTKANILSNAVIQLKIQMYKNNSIHKEEMIKSIFANPSFKTIEEIALIYATNKYDKDDIIKYSFKATEALEELKKASASKENS